MEKKEVFAQFDTVKKNFEMMCRQFDNNAGGNYLDFAVSFVSLENCEIYKSNCSDAANAREYLKVSKRRFVKRMMRYDGNYPFWIFLFKDVLAKNRTTSKISDDCWYLPAVYIREHYLEILEGYKNSEFAYRERYLEYLDELDEYIAPLMENLFSEAKE